jgi:hypothetical protein
MPEDDADASDGSPVERSLTKTSLTGSLSAEWRLVAPELKATFVPSAEIDGSAAPRSA